LNFIKRSLIIIILLIALIYTVNITGIPEKVILFEDEDLNLGEVFGIVLKEKQEETIETSSNKDKIGNKTITLSLFNLIDVKEIEVSTIQNVRVIPLGNTIGLKLYSDGVLVIGMSEIEGQKPYEDTGIQEGDLIVKVDNVEVTTTGELVECVNNCKRRNCRYRIYKRWTRICNNNISSKNRGRGI